jgi:hypothetical protein
MEAILALSLFLIVIIGIVVYLYNSRDTTSQLEDLAKAYKESLAGTDKRLALRAGRAYYGSLRSGKTLTVYDEMAISNDLSIMDTNTPNSDQISLSKL